MTADRPAIAEWPRAALPSLDEAHLPQARRIVARRDAGLTEVRLLVPFGSGGGSAAERTLLATAFGRAADRETAAAIRDRARAMGAMWWATARPQHLLLSAYCLPERLADLLGLLGELLSDPQYAEDVVVGVRESSLAGLLAARGTEEGCFDEAVGLLTGLGTIAGMPVDVTDLKSLGAADLSRAHHRLLARVPRTAPAPWGSSCWSSWSSPPARSTRFWSPSAGAG